MAAEAAIATTITQMEIATMAKNSHTEHRSNNTGRFVTTKYGENHPTKTTKEAVPNPGRGDTGRRKGK